MPYCKIVCLLHTKQNSFPAVLLSCAVRARDEALLSSRELEPELSVIVATFELVFET